MHSACNFTIVVPFCWSSSLAFKYDLFLVNMWGNTHCLISNFGTPCWTSILNNCSGNYWDPSMMTYYSTSGMQDIVGLSEFICRTRSFACMWYLHVCHYDVTGHAASIWGHRTQRNKHMHNTEDVCQSVNLKQTGWHDTHDLVIWIRCRWHPDRWNHSCRVCCHVIAPITVAIGEGEESPWAVSVFVLPIKEDALCLPPTTKTSESALHTWCVSCLAHGPWIVDWLLS